MLNALTPLLSKDVLHTVSGATFLSTSDKQGLMNSAIASELDGLQAPCLDADLDSATLPPSSDLLPVQLRAAASLKGFTLSESAAKTFAAVLSGQSDCDGNKAIIKRALPS